jgi:hypothetical protein
MWEWLGELWASLTWTRILYGTVLFVISMVISIVIVGIVAVRIPENYFSSHYQHDFLPNSSWFTRWGAVVAKNIAGLILVIAGILMLIGPGQGILTILIGLILMDIPGKRPLEARLIKRPIVLAAVNNFRAKYNKPPLVMD